MAQWDPEHYLKFETERGRPFVELLRRIHAEDVNEIVDLGCGPGNMTALLTHRWPQARVRGIDSSAEMITAAQRHYPHVEFQQSDVHQWADSEDSVDVLITNATLQWVPNHLELLPKLVRHIRPGGWFAMGVPGNFEQPTHTIRAEIAGREPYVRYTHDVAVPLSCEPRDYWQALHECGCDVDVWETTYLHVLEGEDPVFAWISGTGARPTLEALPTELRAEFETELRQRLREAYPMIDGKVLLEFRRIFAIAHKSTD